MLASIHNGLIFYETWKNSVLSKKYLTIFFLQIYSKQVLIWLFAYTLQTLILHRPVKKIKFIPFHSTKKKRNFILSTLLPLLPSKIKIQMIQRKIPKPPLKSTLKVKQLRAFL